MSTLTELVSKMSDENRFLPLLVSVLIIIGVGLTLQNFTEADPFITAKQNSIKAIDSTVSAIYSSSDNYSGGEVTATAESKIRNLTQTRNYVESQIQQLKYERWIPPTAVVLVGLFLLFFASAFRRSNNKIKSIDQKEEATFNKKESIRKKKSDDYNDFVQFVLQKHIDDNELKIEEIANSRYLFDMYNYAEKLGDDKVEFLDKLKKYIRYESYLIKSSNNLVHDDIDIVFEDSQKRLSDECNRLNKQALLNIFAAVVTVILAFGGLLLLNANSTKELSEWQPFIISYLPKLTFVISTMTVFLYFARLYQKNISDVKYYQNEITNIEQKYLALNAAVESKNQELVIKIITNIGSLERNAIMNKEQQSLEIERVKVENEMNKNYLDKIFDMFSNFKHKE